MSRQAWETFFVPSKVWRDGGPFPHVLALLTEHEEFRQYARARAELLSQCSEQLGVIPEEWLHSTVQGIHHALDAEQLAQLRGTLRDELAGIQPFRAQLGPVWPGITTVTVAVYPEERDGCAQRPGPRTDAVRGLLCVSHNRQETLYLTRQRICTHERPHCFEDYWHYPPARDLQWIRIGQLYHHLSDRGRQTR